MLLFRISLQLKDNKLKKIKKLKKFYDVNFSIFELNLFDLNLDLNLGNVKNIKLAPLYN